MIVFQGILYFMESEHNNWLVKLAFERLTTTRGQKSSLNTCSLFLPPSGVEEGSLYTRVSLSMPARESISRASQLSADRQKSRHSNSGPLLDQSNFLQE